ncbi:MAG: hypothetical protein CVU77_02865 [Elusimicrobia bacterium HGW-Elusimicrobia-1]|jgi:uncharacterized lipoprotein|nr:MAG: hypothetical protein CVU77_02865 [Elusimicrobia bacterium HGW-Elusimicrobia-1]
MKKVFTPLVLLILVGFIGCATAPVWRPLFPPEYKVSKDFDKVWPKIVAAISEDFDIAILEKESGYLQTNWKEKRGFLGAKETRTRVSVRTQKKTAPLEIDVRAEKQGWESWTEQWIDKGNDVDLEEKVRNAVARKLMGD